jgi:demethylmenaquinone methyltransferase/2-methoxy-6-polyprenyl-1,4-benzoquinol methylase
VSAGGAAAGRGLLRDYSRQARSYDETRGASASVTAALEEALAGAPGPVLADIGGGTGNYALALRERGWKPLVIDRAPEMLARARDKGLDTLLADATALPLEAASFDAAMLVSMLHHVDDRPAAIEEAKRVLRPGGRLVIKMYTREDIEGAWVLDYFPASRPWMLETHPTATAFGELLPGMEMRTLRFTDLEDASMAALSGHPELLLEERWRRQTSYFERLAREHPEDLAAGLERLERDVAAGRPPAGGGTATVIAWTKPA